MSSSTCKSVRKGSCSNSSRVVLFMLIGCSEKSDKISYTSSKDIFSNSSFSVHLINASSQFSPFWEKTGEAAKNMIENKSFLTLFN